MKKYLSILVITSFAFVFAIANAEDNVRLNSSTRAEVKTRPLMDSGMNPRVDAFVELKQEFNAEIADYQADLKAGLITREEFQAKVRAEYEAFRAELKTKLEAFKKEVDSRKEEFRKSSSETKRKFWDNATNMVGVRFEAAFTNLARMQAKVEVAIEKMEDEDKDTGSAEKYLDESKDKLADAKAKLAEVKKLLPEAGAEVSAEVFAEIKLGARETKDLLKESHSALVQALKEVRGLNEDKEEADED